MSDDIEEQLRRLESFRRSIGHGDADKDGLSVTIGVRVRTIRAALEKGPLSKDHQEVLGRMSREVEDYRSLRQGELWAFSEEQLRREFNQAASAVLERARADESEDREVTRRLLWASQSTLADAFAWLAPSLGFPAMWEGPDTITRRLEFANHFVGYQLLDDGDPGIAWIRYAHWRSGESALDSSPWIPCPPRAEGSWRVLTPHRERWCRGYYDEAYVRPKDVLDILDEHEKRALKEVEALQEEGYDEDELGYPATIDEWTAALRRWMESQDILPTSLPS